jgi:gamma-glutamyltranspeptidase/glutathione hydrolase
MATRSTWQVDKTEATGARGMVAAKTSLAAEAGAKVLAAGGNAIDAAVTTACVAWVAEPPMSGIGGGGYLIVHDPATGDHVVSFPMVAPAGATPDMFPLAAGKDTGLFGWPATVGNQNVVGHRSVAVPGNIAGLALALERWGTISLAKALEPAIALCEEGVPVDWQFSSWVARDMAALSRFEATRAIYTNNGLPYFSEEPRNPQRVRNLDLARTLRIIADQGPRAFYEGEIGRSIVAHLREGGAPFAEADFAGYHAHVVAPVRTAFAGHEVLTTGGATGGTTLAQSLRILANHDLAALGHNSPETLHRLIGAFQAAFADRFEYLADPEHVEAPIDAILDLSYAAERAAEIAGPRAIPARAASKARLGVRHDLVGSIPEYTSRGSTTHLSTMDNAGMAVTITQTLLSLWGSRVVGPGTGVLMNNGMMWFDPQPGRPNSPAGGKKPLSNMSPALLLKDGAAVAALGASGGRKILNCVAQLAMNVAAHGLTMQPATSAPRIDCSTPDVIVSDRLPAATIAALRAMGHQPVLSDETLLGGDFSSPASVQRAATADFRGGVDAYYYGATAVGVD